MTCAVCAFADAHGWWGPDHRGTHCRDSSGVTGCHRSWTALKEAHCVVCHEHFSTDGHAQSHRGPSGTCRYPGDVTRTNAEGDLLPRLRLVDRGTGPVWVGAERMDAERWAS